MCSTFFCLELLVDDPELLVLEIGKVSRTGLKENCVLACPLVTEESVAILVHLAPVSVSKSKLSW